MLLRFKKSRFLILFRILVPYILIAAAMILIFSKILLLSVVPSGSMEPTISSGNLILGTRINSRDIQRYDIMIFRPTDDTGGYYIKRVIGLPGETITVSDGNVYADGILLDSSYLKEPMDTSGDGIYIVPDGCYFMLGDNRNVSSDSRFWDDPYVPIENFVGHARLIIFPLHKVALL